MSDYYDIEVVRALQQEHIKTVQGVFEKGLIDQKTYDTFFSMLNERDVEKGEVVMVGIIEETNKLIIGYQTLPIGRSN